jgi:hypothetical protein
MMGRATTWPRAERRRGVAAQAVGRRDPAMGMRFRSLLVLCALFAGCATFPVPEPREPEIRLEVVPTVSDVESLLRYFHYISNLPGEELGSEFEAVRTDYARTRSDFDRVRLAMVLSLPGHVFSDGTAALDLLKPVAKNPNGPLSGLALLLATHAQERSRLDTDVQGLRNKLDALRSLERSLIERNR